MNLELAAWLIPLASELSSIYGDLLEVKHFHDTLYNVHNVSYHWRGLDLSYCPKESLRFDFHIFDKNLFVSCSSQMSSIDEKLSIDFRVEDWVPVGGDPIGSAWLMGALGIRLGKRQSSLNEIVGLARFLKTAKPPASDLTNREQE